MKFVAFWSRCAVLYSSTEGFASDVLEAASRSTFLGEVRRFDLFDQSGL